MIDSIQLILFYSGSFVVLDLSWRVRDYFSSSVQLSLLVGKNMFYWRRIMQFAGFVMTNNKKTIREKRSRNLHSSPDSSLRSLGYSRSSQLYQTHPFWLFCSFIYFVPVVVTKTAFFVPLMLFLQTGKTESTGQHARIGTRDKASPIVFTPI